MKIFTSRRPTQVENIMIQSSCVLYQPRPFPSLSVSSWIRSSPVSLSACYKSAPVWYCTVQNRREDPSCPWNVNTKGRLLGRSKKFFSGRAAFFGCWIVSSTYVSRRTGCPLNFDCLSVPTFYFASQFQHRHWLFSQSSAGQSSH